MTGMSRGSRQSWLDLVGPLEHFQLIHGGHSSNVALCSSTSSATARGAWNERIYAKADAASIVPQLVANGDFNVYQSQHGFLGQRRRASDVVALTSSYVDLDHYRVPGLTGLDAEALLDRVRAAHAWLPVPTLICNSGRGAYPCGSTLVHWDAISWESGKHSKICSWSCSPHSVRTGRPGIPRVCCGS